MLAAPTHSHQAFQHHLPSISYALTRRQPPNRNKTSFGRGVFVFVSHGVELSTQMIVSGPTTGADVKRRIEAFLFEFGTSERDLYFFLTRTCVLDRGSEAVLTACIKIVYLKKQKKRNKKKRKKSVLMIVTAVG